MNVSVYRNLSAIRFIRCVAPVPGASINAGGAALTLRGALIKCESEVIERGFEINELWPKKIQPLGIAAHFGSAEAEEKALHETIETLCVKQVASEKTFNCILFLSFFHFSIGIARTEKGYFCIARGKLRDDIVGATSAGPTLLATLLKAWEEYRSFHFFRPRREKLRTFTKINFSFPENSLQKLKFRFNPKFKYSPQLSALEVGRAVRNGRQIVYFTQSK